MADITNPGIRKLLRLVDWLGATHNPYLRLAFEVTLGSVQIAFALDAWRRVSGPEIGQWLRAVAEFEALSSLAAYAYENPEDTFPEIAADGPCLEGEALGHPLLPRSRCVRNDIALGGDLSVLVVSGSNMSGKSTLMRTPASTRCRWPRSRAGEEARLRFSPSPPCASRTRWRRQSRFYARSRVRRLSSLPEAPARLPPGRNFPSHDRTQAEAGERIDSPRCHRPASTHDLALTQIVDEPRQSPQRALRGPHGHGKITFDYTMLRCRGAQQCHRP